MPAHLKLLFLLGLAAATGQFTACATQARSASATLTPAEARKDLDHLYTGLQASHYDLFAHRPRAEYDARYRKLRRELGAQVDATTLRGEFQRFVAFGNVAHARIDPPAAEWEEYRASGGAAFPLVLRVVGGEVYLQSNYSGLDSIAEGVRVVSIDGESIIDWLARPRALVSADTDYLAYTQMELQLPMLLWWSGDRAARYAVTLEDSHGGLHVVVVPARTRAQFRDAQVPQSPKVETDWGAREARITEHGVGYLRPGPFYDTRPGVDDPWDPADFRAFVDQAFAGFIAKGVDHVVIDLRNNPGGDNSFSDPMVAWFADKPFRFSPEFDIRISTAAIEANARRLIAVEGQDDSTSAKLAAAYADKPVGSRISYPIPLIAPRDGERYVGSVYLLVNRHSYSNAVLVAATAQDYGFGTVIGEETADLASTYGAMETFTLPISGVDVGFPKARMIRPNGDRAARGVVPDVLIESPLVEADGDVVLLKALQHIAEQATR